MAKAYVLSEADRDFLRQLMREQQQRPKNTQGRPNLKPELGQTPDVYIAWAADGIPALTTSTGSGTPEDDSPGVAECEIWRILYGSSPDPFVDTVDTNDRSVHNLSTAAIPAESWVLVVRDKFGSWIAVPTAVGSASGGSGITSINALTAAAQFLTTGVAGNRLNIVSTTATHTVSLGSAFDFLGSDVGNTAATITAFLQANVPSGTMQNDGEAIHVRAGGIFNVTANTDKRIPGMFSGNAPGVGGFFGTGSLLYFMDSGNLAITAGGNWHLDAMIWRTNSGGVRSIATLITSSAVLVATTQYGVGTGTFGVWAGWGDDSEVLVAGSGTSADDVICKVGSVKFIP